jgi:hypothetical protein
MPSPGRERVEMRIRPGHRRCVSYGVGRPRGVACRMVSGSTGGRAAVQPLHFRFETWALGHRGSSPGNYSGHRSLRLICTCGVGPRVFGIDAGNAASHWKNCAEVTMAALMACAHGPRLAQVVMNAFVHGQQRPAETPQRTDAEYGLDERTTLHHASRRIWISGYGWHAFVAAAIPTGVSRRSRGLN